MLTGRQVREARRLLGWRRLNFSRRVGLTEPTLAAVESSDGPAWLTDRQESVIRHAFEEGGVAFEADGTVRIKMTP